MHFFGPKTPSAGDSTNDSALMGADRVRGSDGECRISQPNGLPHSWIAAPAVQLLSSGYSAPKPICCGPVGRRWFPESRVSPRPAAPPWMREVLSPPRMVGFIGALVSSVARWAQFALGDRAPERAVCGGWRRSRMEIGWLAGRPDSGQNRITMRHARTTQMRMREARSRVPHVTSRQDSKFMVRHVSTVHRSPTINPQFL